MKESVDAYDPSEKSRSGLVGKEGGLMDEISSRMKSRFVEILFQRSLQMR